MPFLLNQPTRETKQRYLVGNIRTSLSFSTSAKDDEPPVSPVLGKRIGDAFRAVRAVIASLPEGEDPWETRLQELENSGVPDTSSFGEREQLSLSCFSPSVKKYSVDFYKYYSAVCDNGEPMFPRELDKRIRLQQALRDVGCDSLVMQRLLFLLSSKAFIVAYSAMVTDGFDFDAVFRSSIFRTRPSLGMDLTDLFEQHLQDVFTRGTVLLNVNVDPAFLSSIASDCVTYHELMYLTTTTTLTE